jgi:serine kinase of HPr protein (carbohydrate metabolism regulator)
MRPVAVREILTYKERLGITEMIEPPGACASVRHLFRYAGSEPGRDVTPLPHTMFILPPTRLYATNENGWDGSVAPLPFRNISCLALTAQRIPVFLRKYSERTETAIFSSSYDDTLLHSRLTGLLREKGDRQVMVHAVLIQVWGFGVLLLGESGVGKTACGLALMTNGSRWVADDAVVLEGRGDAVYGRGHWRTGGWIAVRGKGFFRVADLFGRGGRLPETRVDMLIRLVRGSGRDAAEKGELLQKMVGVSLPCRDLEADIDPRRVAEQVKGCVRPLLMRSSGVMGRAATA